MGVYDILPGGQQVKVWWCDLRKVKIGDEVLAARGLDSYSIALEEGRYANVFDLTLMSVTEVPMIPDVVDIWGAEVENANKELLCKVCNSWHALELKYGKLPYNKKESNNE